MRAKKFAGFQYLTLRLNAGRVLDTIGSQGAACDFIGSTSQTCNHGLMSRHHQIIGVNQVCQIRYGAPHAR